MTIIVKKLKLGNGKLKVLIKDTIDIKNTITQAGCQAFENSPEADENAYIIDYILAHDCSIIGKTNLHELAFGITGVNHFTGTPINPKYPDLICGGSSSGSAVAVAKNLCDFSIGTDTGGSIRMPAACCDIYGLKPTFGRVSRKGILPEYSTLDCVGPFASNLTMLIQAMQIIDPTFEVVDSSEIELSNLSIVFLDVPARLEIWNAIQIFFTYIHTQKIKKVSLKYMEKAFYAGMKIINYETYQAYSDLIDNEKIGEDINSRLKTAGLTTLADIKSAEEIRKLFTEEIDQLLLDNDLLVLPTLPEFPPKLIDVEDTSKLLNLTALIRPFNLSGHPALTIPLETPHHFPIGLQLIAKHGQDEKLCAIAEQLVKSFHSNSI